MNYQKLELKASTRLVLSATWFDTLTEVQKQEYLKEHPTSKYAKGYHPAEEDDEDDSLGEAEDSPEHESLMSRLRSKIIESLGGTVERRTMKTIKGFPSEATFAGHNEEREVKIQYTPTMIKNRDKEDRFGYWKDKNTYVYMTKKEFKSLSKKQLQNIEHRQKLYGLN